MVYNVFLRLDSSHLNEHKVCHTFKDRPNSTPDCSSATETTVQSLLQFQQYQSIRLELLNSTFDLKMMNLFIGKHLHLLLYGPEL